jgi:hypothetical protein
MPLDVEYTSKYSLCFNFASDGACTRAKCPYSHSLIDTARLVALVGDLSSSSGSAPADEKTYFLLEYTKYSAIVDGADPDDTKWRMRLLGGGRATLCAGGLGTDVSARSVNVQPVYPVKGQAREAGAALDALERKVFGRSYPVMILSCTRASCSPQSHPFCSLSVM